MKSKRSLFCNLPNCIGLIVAPLGFPWALISVDFFKFQTMSHLLRAVIVGTDKSFSIATPKMVRWGEGRADILSSASIRIQ